MHSFLKVKMKEITLLFCLCSGTICYSTNLQAVDGKTFLEYCQAYVDVLDNEHEQLQDPIGAGYCLGFVIGAASMLSGSVCLPEDEVITGNKLTRMMVKYLQDHPEDLVEEDVQLTGMALMEAYPCN